MTPCVFQILLSFLLFELVLLYNQDKDSDPPKIVYEAMEETS